MRRMPRQHSSPPAPRLGMRPWRFRSHCTHSVRSSGGTAVALTMTGLVSVPRATPRRLCSRCLAAIIFVAGTARLGLPASATYGLLGGLAGAALVSGGAGDIRWGGLDGLRPDGMAGALAGLAISPVVGAGAGWLVRRLVRSGTARATRRALGPVKGGIWVAAGLVALSDGTNDGQKAMGISAAACCSRAARSSGSRCRCGFASRRRCPSRWGRRSGGGRVIRRVGPWLLPAPARSTRSLRKPRPRR